MDNLLLIVVGVAVILAVSYAIFNYFCIKKLEEGTDRMGEIAGAIRIGANAFIRYEYKLVAIIGSVIAVVVFLVISWQAAIAFVIGAVMSAAAGWIGMKIATYSNVRVTNKARETGDLGKTLKVAFKGGSVMGLCVAGFALLGVIAVYCIFGLAAGQIKDIAEGTIGKNFITGLDASFTMTLSGYALGCSIIAMFNRVGGGIYTKAADMGADLVGKTEAHIPEDDPRNPATIADNVGNTTAAIGKGFAIGSAAFAALSLMTSYLYAFTETNLLLNLIDPLTLCGALCGAALPFMFSGMLIQAVAKAARKMVEEVRRQFREIPGLMEGETMPDYKTCIEISSQGALKEMRIPCIMCILFPIVTGFIFGPMFVAGMLIGATVAAIMLALFCGNAGGAWDKAKKYIEAGGVEGEQKGSAAHDASVVGDTVGDPLKDTVGPSLDILIKIMSTVSLVAVVVFSKYNLFGVIFG